MSDQNQNRQLTVVDTLRKMEPQFKVALPAHIPVEKFTRVAVTAAQSNPDILNGKIDQRSVLGACMKAAQDGLVIDGREAALVIFGNQATYMPMVAGVLKKMRNSGEIANISTGLVYRNEFDQGRFEYIKGDEESLTHKPILFDDKGDMIGVYAIVTLKDGSKVREFMDMNQINKVRNVSRSKDRGPWKDWFEEMATKSVLRKVSKLCPSSSDLDGIFKREDEEDEHDPVTGEVPENQPARRQTVKERMKAASGTDAPPPPPEGLQGVQDADVIEGTTTQATQNEEDAPV